MKKGLYDFDFTRTCLLNGVGLLVCCAPSIYREPVQYANFGIGQYFHNVGIYLHAACESESPQLAQELRQQALLDRELRQSENQLELHLHS